MSRPPETAPTSPPRAAAAAAPVAVGPGPGPAVSPGAALVWLALAIVYVVWGSTYLGIKIAVETLPPFGSAALRFAAAAAVLAALLAVRRPRSLRVDRRQLGSAALVGVLLLAGGNGLVVLAESGPPGVAVPSGSAALLVATVPLLVVILRAATGDRPRAATVGGVLLGFAGLVLLVLPVGAGAAATAAPLVGALTVVLAATSWSVGSFLAGRLPMPADPFAATAYEMLAGAAALALISVLRGELRGFSPAEVSGRSWAALAYLTVAGSLVAFTAYVWLLHHAPLSLVATYAYVNPVVAVALGAALVAEQVTPQVVLGGLVIVVGVALVVTTERPRSPARVGGRGDRLAPAHLAEASSLPPPLGPAAAPSSVAAPNPEAASAPAAAPGLEEAPDRAGAPRPPEAANPG